jgi:hypothetical protein
LMMSIFFVLTVKDSRQRIDEALRRKKSVSRN